MKRTITFDEILQQPRSAEVWGKLKRTVPESDLIRVQRLLVALANRRRSFTYHPPSPRDARRFADHLEKDVSRIRKFTLYFGAGLPLGDVCCRDLAETVERYAGALKEASRSREKQRQSLDVPEEEAEILSLLSQSVAGKERLHCEEAATLIQAGYDAGGIHRTVSPEQLRKLYDRQSFQDRVLRARRRPENKDIPTTGS
jgi:hypothetical protein